MVSAQQENLQSNLWLSQTLLSSVDTDLTLKMMMFGTTKNELEKKLYMQLYINI